ncbi:MAG: hypothetical protein IK137_01795 [Bacilli bacterium]|nr:hypothetical protein [Bacilli bacterium]
MDVKTRLEDDTVLFDKLSAESRTAKVRILNSIGIYTIEDYINFKESDFPKYSKRESYWAMAHIFRHEYLKEDLIYDVLLEKEYYSDYTGCKLCYSDMLKMGIMNSGYKLYAVRDIMDFLAKNNKEASDKFSIEWLINSMNSRYFNRGIFHYYLEYIEKKKKDKQPILDGSVELSTLKIQLQTLVSLDESLQAQINELQEKINRLEGGQSVHGK